MSAHGGGRVSNGRLRSLAGAAACLGALLLAPGSAPAHQDRAAVPAAPEGMLSAGQRAVMDALARGDLPGARAAGARLPAAGEPADLVLRSHVAFQDGDYGEAARLLGALPAPLREGPAAAALALARASEQMRARLVARESEHFVLWHDPLRDWVLVEPALEALEAGYRALGDWLGDRPAEKVRVEVVPTAEDFERVSSLAKEEIETAGAVGICKFNKIMVLSPRLLLRGYPWRDTLNHEYLHHLLVRLSGNRAPIWLQEGVARFGEARWRDPGPQPLGDVDRSLIARALREGVLIPFSSMDPSLVRLPTAGAVRLAFAECALAVEHLLGRWGDDGLRRLLAALAAGDGEGGTGPALAAALGVTFEAFEREWREGLAARGFTEVPGVVVPAFRLAGEGAAEEWDLAEWQSGAAQNHLRLGDLLRRRGAGRPALMEYERARTLAPGSPFVHLKIARAELEQQRPERAAAAAREAVRLFPEYPAGQEALALALAGLGDLAGAAAAAGAALEVNPYNPFAWGLLAEVRGRQGRTEEAVRARQTALRLAQDNEATKRQATEPPGEGR